MNAKCLLLWLFTAAVAIAAETPKAIEDAPATITGVAPAKDGRTLVIRYELQARAHEVKVVFTNELADFRYCPWMGTQGIALAAATHPGDFYYLILYLNGQNVANSPVRIPAPAGRHRLLGIANTGGDSVVVTALNHSRDNPGTNTYGPDRLTGWMYIDNCPGMTIATGLVLPFDLHDALPTTPLRAETVAPPQPPAPPVLSSPLLAHGANPVAMFGGLALLAAAATAMRLLYSMEAADQKRGRNLMVIVILFLLASFLYGYWEVRN